jgi:hypothetical protein
LGSGDSLAATVWSRPQVPIVTVIASRQLAGYQCKRENFADTSAPKIIN